MKDLDELAQDEILRSITVYQLLRPCTRVNSEGEIERFTSYFDIMVFKYINGERKGQFLAKPYLAFHYGADAFAGRGDTEQEALYAMLDTIKGVSREKIFPDVEW